MNEPGSKPYVISKQVVVAAFEKVRSNKGAAGVDGVAVEQYAQDGKNNLYKLWNRMSSGSYFPAPVKMVKVPKDGGRGMRELGGAHCPRSDRPDGGGGLPGAEGGTGVPLRLLRLSAGSFTAGCGGDLPEAVLALPVGDRFGH